MKFVTAEEARGLIKPQEDRVSKVINAINKRVRERSGMGHTQAIIGYSGETEVFADLSPADQEAICGALKMAGYKVSLGPAPKTIKLHWGYDEEET